MPSATPHPGATEDRYSSFPPPHWRRFVDAGGEGLPHPHGQQPHNLLDRQARLFAQRGLVVVGDRMIDHRERIVLQSIHRAYRLRGAREAVGDDGHRRNAKALGFNCVVQTARRATASVAYGGEHGVGAAQLHQHGLRHGARGVGLAAAYAFAHAVFGA